jgi:hypothetical protein
MACRFGDVGHLSGGRRCPDPGRRFIDAGTSAVEQGQNAWDYICPTLQRAVTYLAKPCAERVLEKADYLDRITTLWHERERAELSYRNRRRRYSKLSFSQASELVGDGADGPQP